MARQVLQKDVTAGAAENIHRRAGVLSERGMIGAAERGHRVAKASPPLFMTALEKVAEVLDSMGESQFGETRRDTSTAAGHRVEATIIQAWKEAYRSADSGPSCGLRLASSV